MQILRSALQLVLFLSLFSTIARGEILSLHARHRVEGGPNSNQWLVVNRDLAWDAGKTALVICDMWNEHWCHGATKRVAEMAPRMNEVVKRARAAGVFVIHCPSDTMKYYSAWPQRSLATSAPPVAPKVPLQRWCSLDKTKEAPLPIDDADGGCDDDPPCKGGGPWRHQIDAIEIHPGDAVTDSAEAYYLMEQRGITNLIVMGVHLNMCVLGRPFSIRQMVAQGKNVLLMRDMTDTMYNSRQRPYVPHCIGTQLMIEHVERFWCPSITSVDLIGGEEFRFAEDRRPRAVFLIGEDEYRTWETLPEFARTELGWRGFDVSIVLADPANKNHFPALVEALHDADLLVVSLRRRALPESQLAAVRRHLEAGRPLVGIRTASHGFDPRPADVAGGSSWPSFDPDVLGGNYHNHHGNGTKTIVTLAPEAKGNPVLAGIDPAQLIGNGSLYKVSPLKPAATPLLLGTIPNQPTEPVAWIHTFGTNRARIFYTSLGHPDDFLNQQFRRLLLNGISWAVNRPIPTAVAAATIPR